MYFLASTIVRVMTSDLAQPELPHTCSSDAVPNVVVPSVETASPNSSPCDNSTDPINSTESAVSHNHDDADADDVCGMMIDEQPPCEDNEGCSSTSSSDKGSCFSADGTGRPERQEIKGCGM